MAMEDTRSASLVLIIGAAGVAYWWFHLTSGKLAAASAADAQPGPQGPTLAPGPTVTSNDDLGRLLGFAAKWGLKVTSGEHILPSGQEIIPQTGHTSGSLHYSGEAIDVGGQLSQAAEQAAAQVGIHVLPEPYTGEGPSGYSSGPHTHLSFPQMRNGRLVY